MKDDLIVTNKLKFFGKDAEDKSSAGSKDFMIIDNLSDFLANKKKNKKKKSKNVLRDRLVSGEEE
jgi:hypothetical protein